MVALVRESVSHVADALRALAPVGVATGCLPVRSDDVGSLHRVEAAAVADAVPQRRAEFATGRMLLRQLLGAYVAIPRAPDRRPALPAGKVGSLAHADRLAVAAVGDSSSFSALGIDIEPDAALDAATAGVILRADEREIDAHVAFTLKEAVYKAWSELGGRMLEHHELRLSFRNRGQFRGAVVGGDMAGGAAMFDGRWARAAGHLLALVVVPAPG